MKINIARCNICKESLKDPETGEYKPYTQRFREEGLHYKLICSVCMVKEKAEDSIKETERQRRVEAQMLSRIETKKQMKEADDD